MPELKQPQEAAEKTTEQPLTTKKKRAMLEYMAIMFAAAFLLVAISLLIKVIDMKGEMEAANTGARENIALLQKDLDAARAESAELQTKLDEANAAAIVDMLSRLAHEDACCVIVVTHDPAVAAKADVMLRMSDGRLCPGG